MSSSSEPIGSDRYKYFQLLKEQYPIEEALCSEIGRISARSRLMTSTGGQKKHAYREDENEILE